MEKNSYQAVKGYIFDKLNKMPSPLDKAAIHQEISNLQGVIAAVPVLILHNILSVSEFIDLKDVEWKQLKHEFEVHFDVGMRHGTVIQGNEQQLRDNSWWTSLAKGKSDLYYWDRYKTYLYKSLPPNVVKTTDDDTDVVMNNLESPSTDRFSRYGMVVGHVQSGKTLNYSSLVCKAADAGYKFIVIIAGGINNLRDQTQERMNESFVGYSGGEQVGAGIGNGGKHLTPYSLTTTQRDFNRQDADRLAQGINFETVNVPVLLVIKKNTSTLKSVIEWLEKQYRGNDIEHAMLVIDDESDYASINTKGENDPTIINKRLRQLLSLFKRSAYVAYTATPYANIFIDHKANNDSVGKDLFPKDFIYALNAPTNYFGARKIFIDTNQRHLIAIDDHETVIPYTHKKDFILECLPENLLDAIRLFLINISIRRLRGQGDKHNSMLIHATRFTDVHKNLATLAEEYLTLLKKDTIAYAALEGGEGMSVYLKQLAVTYKNHVEELNLNWNDVLLEFPNFVETIVIRDVHAKSAIPLEYRKDVVTNAIVVGGASLARGFTVEGLSVSYFLRNTVFYDTLMQMGRWFGYRPGYEDLCRIFMPQDRINDFAEIIRATEDLVDDFKLMAENRRTPEDFGLYIKENPDSALQVTARNKQHNMEYYYFDMRLEGSLKETSYLRKEPNVITDNIRAIQDLIDNLPTNHSPDFQSVLWTDIDRSLVKKFVNTYKTYDKDKLGLSSRMPIGFIKEYINQTDTLWDIALYSGDGEEFSYKDIKLKRQQRVVADKNGAYEVLNRQVSSGTSEAIAIKDPELRRLVSNNRKKSRGMRTKPLLMLHLLEVENKEGDIKLEEIAAFGISFNGTALSEAKPVRLMVNTVFLDQLEDRLDEGEE
ncbi:Z1 domain-containing protein [Pedobacter hartonius]|uniref:Z1 domain-containing protein n=1 Tax=Pedobacter hartonius TaxID=425514 RepID=A0A1H4HFI8_9SPHI|nr:Z1 domain-containing protein [Pedobacter hartonius]SEB20574.1 Z1 domain-containing protein [Pedobacter hartonius]